MKRKISIIIPILNEAESIGKLIQHLLKTSKSKNSLEIIVADGGSTDGSQDIVQNLSSEVNALDSNDSVAETNTLLVTHTSKPISQIKLITSEKGRAKQLNSGAKEAQAEILYFLHADSFPPKNFDTLIISEVNKGNQAGCFRMQFDSGHWWLKYAGWFTQFSWRACRGGDQSQFITRKLFDDIGGYDEDYIIYEDNILINALYSRKEFTVINSKLRSSARLYHKHGVGKVQYHFAIIYVKKWCGASAEGLSAYYKKHLC